MTLIELVVAVAATATAAYFTPVAIAYLLGYATFCAFVGAFVKPGKETGVSMTLQVLASAGAFAWAYFGGMTGLYTAAGILAFWPVMCLFGYLAAAVSKPVDPVDIAPPAADAPYPGKSLVDAVDDVVTSAFGMLDAASDLS